MEKKHIRVNKSTVKPVIDEAKNQELEQNALQQIQEYNNSFNDIPEIYKQFNPSPGYVLVRLKLGDEPNFEALRLHPETGHAQGTVMGWYGQDASRRAYGVVITGGGYEYGTDILVSPMAFYAQNWLVSTEYIFSTPKHQLPGFFLIPKNLILGTY